MRHAGGSRKPVAAWVASALLLVLLTGVAARLLRKPEPAFSQRDVYVKRGDISATVSAAGAVTPHTRIAVNPPMPCRIEAILVSEGQRVQQDQVVARISSPERAALLSSARLKGEAEVRKWQEIYKTIPLSAPITGMVLSCPVQPGQMLSPDADILVLADRLVVKAHVDESDIGLVVTGQCAEVALDSDPGASFTATVARVAFEARTLNNVSTFEVELEAIDMPRTARCGMTANVVFTTAARTGVLVVPRAALGHEGGRTVVRLVTDSGRLTTREVQIGLRQGDDVEITDGLGEGDVVRVIGNEESPADLDRRPPASPLLPSFTGKAKD